MKTDKRKVANHYHVLVGLPGYMPASNCPCETLAEAGDMALYKANAFRESGYHRDWGKDALGFVTGNKRIGYDILRQPDGDESRQTLWQTITISPCDEADCRCVCCGTLLDADGISPCEGCGV